MERLISIMKSDFEEFHSTRKISRAEKLSKDIKMHVNHNEYPSYFFGNPEAKFVLVHLKPKQVDNYSDVHEESFKFTDFDEYFGFHRYYGKIHYGEDTTIKLKSSFDAKQVKFIKPFNVINLNDANGHFSNLEKVIDDKLQLELLPFGSNSFETNKVESAKESLQPYVEILLDTITSQERDYVVFCGKVFETLLQPYIVFKEDHAFKLPKVKGGIAVNYSRFSNVTLEFNNKRFSAGIAQSFAQMGINMSEYGKKCSELYNLSKSLK
jgi:hypothetical protein